MMPLLVGKVKLVMVYFDNFLTVAGATKGKKCFSAKESKACAISFAFKRVKELDIKRLIFSRMRNML